jgi:hypothetical protein
VKGKIVAEIHFTLEEAADIAKETVNIPNSIDDIWVSDGYIYVKLSLPLVPTIKLKYEKFENKKVYLTITPKTIISVIMSLIGDRINDFIVYNNSLVEIDVNQMLAKKINNVVISDIKEIDDEIIIFVERKRNV